jgi:outer membrane protein assembly factor BamB
VRKLVVLVMVVLGLGTAVGKANAAPSTCAVTSLLDRCERWSDRVGTPVLDGGHSFKAVEAAPDGSRVVSAGSTPGATGGWDFLVTGNDSSSGARRWTSTFDAGGDDQGVDMAMSPDGTKVFVTGQSERAPGNYDYATVAFDVETGRRLGAARYNAAANAGDFPTAIDISPDGTRLFVTGYSQVGVHASASVPVYAATTVAYSASTGAQQWKASYQGAARLWDIPKAVAAAGGRVYITARSNETSIANDATDDVTVAYDQATGAQLWARVYDSGARDYPYALATSVDGSRVYVTGERTGFGSDYVTLAYDGPSGTLAWSKTYASLNGMSEVPLSVAVSPAGDTVFVTGFGFTGSGPTDRGILTVAYSKAGQELWVSRHTAPGGEAGSKVAVSPDGRHLYVAGLAVGHAVGAGVGLVGTSYVSVQAPVTVALDAGTGSVAWSAHFAGQGAGHDVDVSPDSSRVFVAAGGSEAVTIAYDR